MNNTDTPQPDMKKVGWVIETFKKQFNGIRGYKPNLLDETMYSLGLDSLDVFDTIAHLESEFKIHIPWDMSLCNETVGVWLKKCTQALKLTPQEEKFVFDSFFHKALRKPLKNVVIPQDLFDKLIKYAPTKLAIQVRQNIK